MKIRRWIWIRRRSRRRTWTPIAAWGEDGGKVWRDHGALEFREYVAEDVKVGKRTSFPRSVKLEPGETVVFSFISYKSRAHRDRVNAKVMKDPRLAKMMNPKAMPFDGKRIDLRRLRVHGRRLTPAA